MQKELGTPGAIVGMIVLSCLFGGLALAVYPGWPAIGTWLGRIDAPAWVQAVGSIAAIFAAGAIATAQAVHMRRLEEDKRNSQDIQRLSVVKALMVRSHVLALEVVSARSEPRPDLEYTNPALMRDTAASLLKLPLFEIPGGLLALDVLTVGRGIGALATAWETYAEWMRTTRGLATEAGIFETAKELADISLEAVKTCDSEIAKCRSTGA